MDEKGQFVFNFRVYKSSMKKFILQMSWAAQTSDTKFSDLLGGWEEKQVCQGGPLMLVAASCSRAPLQHSGCKAAKEACINTERLLQHLLDMAVLVAQQMPLCFQRDFLAHLVFGAEFF